MAIYVTSLQNVSMMYILLSFSMLVWSYILLSLTMLDMSDRRAIEPQSPSPRVHYLDMCDRKAVEA